MADLYTLTLDVPGVPKADDEVVARLVGMGLSDPSLVEVPGMGQFQNGTENEVTLDAVLVTARQFATEDGTEVKLPPGVHLAAYEDAPVEMPEPNSQEGKPSQSPGKANKSVKTPDKPATTEEEK